MRLRGLLLPVVAALGCALCCAPALNAQTAADSAWARQDRAAARQLYLQQLQQDSTDAQALFRLALLDGWAGRPGQSIVWLDRLLRIAPEDHEARAARARMLVAAGRFHDGMLLADSLLQAHPDDIAALQTRAQFAYWDADIARADSLWRRALRADSANAQTRTGLSRVLRRRGRYAEAWQLLSPALARSPNDIDLRDEHDWVAASYRPRVRSGAGYEDDSDGNVMTTFVFSAALPAAARVQVRADAYLRNASLDATGRSVIARGASAAASFALENDWLLELSGGASHSDAPGANTLPSAGVALISPRGAHAVATLSLTRAVWDYTAPMAENEVVVDEARLALDLVRDRDWSALLAAGLARFDIRRQDDENRRWSAQAQLTRRLTDRLSLALGVRGFGFNRDLVGGYYDPDFYGLADARLAVRVGSGRFTLDTDIAPGVQLAGADGDPEAALHVAADLGWSIRPGRRLGLRAVYANTGVNQLSRAARESYRYTSLGFQLAWWF